MKIEIGELSEQLREFLKPIFGKACCRQRVSAPRGLRLGFGDKVFHGNPRLVDAYYGEWEIGTYYCAWRVLQGDRVICGSSDSVESINELDAAIRQITFGAIQSIEHITPLDVRVRCDSGILIDFLTTTSDGTEECLGIIHNSTHRAAEFTLDHGWRMGASNLPWRPENK
jgi:hypothetical protein